jgi:hypothetical protein
MANGFSRQCESCLTNRTRHALWIRREQLIEMLVMEGNRLEHAPKTFHRRLGTYINYLRRQIKHVDKDLDRVVRSLRNAGPV